VDGMPLIIFYAYKDIEKGAEICIDYGNDYWLDTVRVMLEDHKAYYEWSYRYMQYLLAQCSEYKLPLPKKPSKCVESYGLFEKKLKKYPQKMLPPPSEVEWEIDYIKEKYMDCNNYAFFELYYKGW
jgi:hypothetical protein